MSEEILTVAISGATLFVTQDLRSFTIVGQQIWSPIPRFCIKDGIIYQVWQDTYNLNSIELRKIQSYKELCDEVNVNNIDIKGT
jgi:hypothetical protein